MQAGILAAASIIVRIIGLLYRSPLTAIIGDEGNGYYGTAYNIYTIILLISSYSIPSALSKLMSEKMAVREYRNARRVFQCALIYAVVMGGAASLFLFFGAGMLVSEGAVPVLRVFAPTIFVFGILGVLRGYFQAHQTMVQTSVSQILEQLVNAAVSIGAAGILMKMNAGKGTSEQARYGAMGSALGTGSGVLIALLFVGWCFYLNRGYMRRRVRRDKSPADDFGVIMRETVFAITPFVLSSFILNLTTSLNQTIYIKSMIGYHRFSEVMVTTDYGIFSNKAVVITNIPISIATAVSAAILPGISASFARGNLEETRKQATDVSRITLLTAIPCAFGLMALAWPVTLLLFPQMNSLEMAAQLLALLSVTVVFYSVSTVTNAVLQAIGKMQMPLISAGIALTIQTILLLVMIRGTDMGIYSLVLSSVVYAVLIFAMNEYFLHRYLRVRPDVLQIYIKPFAAALLMGIGALGVYAVFYKLLSALGTGLLMRNLLGLIPAMAAAVGIYFFVLLSFRAISEEDLRRIPKGTVMIRIFKKLHWM